MSSCFVCKSQCTLEVALCARCMALLSVEDVVPQQIRGEADPGATAYIIDQWGRCFSVADGMTLGREPEKQGISVAFHSVSRIHAGFREHHSGTWVVADLGSTNGTEVNDELVDEDDSRVLAHGDRVVFGGVQFYFVCEAPGRVFHLPSKPSKLTVDERITKVTAHGRKRARRVELTPFDGGGLFALGKATVELPVLEFAFIDRLLRESMTPGASGGFVVVDEFDSLPWTTPKSNFSSNMLRALVHRVRTRLARAGVPEIIESQRGRGYRLIPTYAPNVETLTA